MLLFWFMYTPNVWTFWTLLYHYVQVQGQCFHEYFMYRLSCDTQLPMTMMTHSLLVTGSSCAPLPPPAPFCPQPGGSCLLLAAKEKQVDSAVSPQCRRVKLHLLFPSFLKNKHQEKKKKDVTSWLGVTVHVISRHGTNMGKRLLWPRKFGP